MSTGYEQSLLRRAIERRAQKSRDHGHIADTGPAVVPMGQVSPEDRFNGRFDDQTGEEIDGFMYIGQMNTGP